MAPSCFALQVPDVAS